MRAPNAQRSRRSLEEVGEIVIAQLALTDRALGAYDIAAHATAAGSRILANQVYRTLGWLVATGRIIRIETLSAYILRRDDSAEGFLVCAECRRVQGLLVPEAVTALSRHADRHFFRIDRPVIEVCGLCASCNETRRETAPIAACSVSQ